MGQKHFNRLLFSVSFALLAPLGLASCSKSGGGGDDSSDSSAKPVSAYCPYLPSKTFSSNVTVSGKALYEYRKDGNGEVANGGHTLTASATTQNQTVSLTINGTAFTFTCPRAIGCTAAHAITGVSSATGLVDLINADSSLAVTASGTSTLILTPDVEGDSITLTALTKLTDSARGDLGKIRFAEVRVTDSSGELIQCAETNASGEFSFQLPSNSGDYSVSVTSRASNSNNTAYILDNPTDNKFYSISASVGSTSDTSNVKLIARATGSLEGGAFNIMDQIYTSQNYLRTQTADCNVSSSSNYFPDCTPFTTAPIVYVYWTPGLSPGTYYGISGGISFYLNGERELYILGGVDGNTEKADMDHFDNSVIIHEYGHFIEDQFAKPDSPGGSHNGDSVIDPRLAWGEGWADFFQAAVTGNPVYRDTYGHVNCTTSGSTPCTGVSFNIDLDPTGSSYDDKPTALGEGNFREFSVTRLLWDVIKPSGGTSQFSEIWAAFNGSTSGMKAVDDPFKGIGRFHVIQQASSGATDWSTLRTDEKHRGDLTDYGRNFSLNNSCSNSPITMTPVKGTGDDGSYAKSDQLRNNDFYRFVHTGGNVTLELIYDKPLSGEGDLDLFIYKPDYVYGKSADMLGVSNSDTDRVDSSTTGKETISASLSAGTYMINVMAYTGVRAGPSTTYVLKLNGTTICPE